MKRILVLGAGQSTPQLISYLLEHAEQHDWFITVGDRGLKTAKKRIGDHVRGSAISFNINDSEMREAQISRADIVVNMLPPVFQQEVAHDCVKGRTHMVSASYEDLHLRNLNSDANRHGVLLLNECGLDPGIDHMSAMALINSVRSDGGVITGFRSYGTGLPTPEFDGNPFRYAITWNPRNVVMSGEKGATYLIDGKVKMVPHHKLFHRTWAIDVPGIGNMEAYPNRDSMHYKRLYKLDHATTMIRGTLRYPGWCERWLQVVRLGIPNETMRLPDTAGLTYRDMIEMFLPVHAGSDNLEQSIATFLGISRTGKIMEDLIWLGLFSDTPLPKHARTASEAMSALLVSKLQLGEKDRDMVLLMHNIDAHFPQRNNVRERITSIMIQHGESRELTAMSRAVGLPVGIATKLILSGEIPLTGCQIPTHPAVHVKVLAELETLGMQFDETREVIAEEDGTKNLKKGLA